MKIKVCFVVSSLSNQGPPNVMYNIIRYMDFSRFDVSIITMVEEQKISRLEDFRKLPIRIVQMHPKGIQNPIAMYFTLRRTVKKLNPDILHTHCPRSMFLVPFLSKKYKKIETVHIYPGIQQKVMYGKWKGQIVIWLSHFFTKKMDLPIACSESVAQSYWDEQHYKMLAIPNGCSLPAWKRDMTEKARLRKELGMRDDLRYFIFIGRFSQEKNPDVIVKAFETLLQTHKDIGLVLLGNGDMFEEISAHTSDRIMVPGFKTNVYEYLKAVDFYISASDVEGLANTLLESMAVGLPCALSDIPSHREVIVKASQPFGYTFDRRNVEQVTATMEKVMKLDPEMTATYIQGLFEKHYTARHMSERYQEEYEKIMDKEREKNNEKDSDNRR